MYAAVERGLDTYDPIDTFRACEMGISPLHWDTLLMPPTYPPLLYHALNMLWRVGIPRDQDNSRLCRLGHFEL